MKAHALPLAFLLFVTSPAAAQLTIGSVAFDIRKSFDGGKAESEAGQVSFIDIVGDEAKPTWLIDLGIRTSLRPWPIRPTLRLTVSPVFEWHHANADGLRQVKAVHKVQAGAQAELLWSNVSPTVPSSEKTTVALQLVGKAEYSWNVLKEQHEGTFALLATPYGQSGITDKNEFRPSAWPGGIVRTTNRRFARYFPYVGVEQHLKLAIGDNPVIAPPVDAWTSILRVRVEVFPIDSAAGLGTVPLVLSGEALQRSLLNDVPTLEGVALSFWAASASWFFGADRNFGIGYTFESGRQPLTNFEFQRRSSVTLKIKY